MKPWRYNVVFTGRTLAAKLDKFCQLAGEKDRLTICRIPSRKLSNVPCPKCGKRQGPYGVVLRGLAWPDTDDCLVACYCNCGYGNAATALVRTARTTSSIWVAVVDAWERLCNVKPEVEPEAKEVDRRNSEQFSLVTDMILSTMWLKSTVTLLDSMLKADENINPVVIEVAKTLMSQSEDLVRKLNKMTVASASSIKL